MRTDRTFDGVTNNEDSPTEVVARLRLLDPRRDAQYEVGDVEMRMARITSTKGERHGRRYRYRRNWTYASLGALVTSGVVAVAVVLSVAGQSASNPTKGTVPKTLRSALPSPVLRIRSGGTAQNGYGGLQTGAPTTYDFSASPSLSTSAGSATAYRFSSPSDVAATTGTIAKALGLAGGVTYLGPDNYNGGPSPGPDATVDVVAGIVNWLYPTWSGNVHTDPGLAGPQSIPVDPALPLPTNDQATASARQLLVATGLSASQLGTPQVSRYEAGVNVSFSVAVEGLSTDQTAQVEYGPGSTVLTASGIVATATASAAYPTIAPSQTVGLLTDGDGASLNPPVSGPSGTWGSSGTNAVSVDIDRAVLSLSTYELADGSTWLLPTWVLSGPESGSGARSGSIFSGNVLAIPSEYVQFAAPR